MNHLNWKQEAHGDGFFFSGLAHPDFEPGPAISASMRFLDEPLDRAVKRVASYGPSLPVLAGGNASEEELHRHEAYLRALGYTN